MTNTEKIHENITDYPGMANGVIRLKPQQFIHLLDNNTGITRLEVGPQTIALRDHERLVLPPQPMIIVPPRPKMQGQVLAGWGWQSVLITDGKNPINEFGMGKGLMGVMGSNGERVEGD